MGEVVPAQKQVARLVPAVAHRHAEGAVRLRHAAAPVVGIAGEPEPRPVCADQRDVSTAASLVVVEGEREPVGAVGPREHAGLGAVQHDRVAVEILDPLQTVEAVVELPEMLDDAAVAQRQALQPWGAQVEVRISPVVRGKEVERPREADRLAVRLEEVELAALRVREHLVEHRDLAGAERAGIALGPRQLQPHEARPVEGQRRWDQEIPPGLQVLPRRDGNGLALGWSSRASPTATGSAFPTASSTTFRLHDALGFLCLFSIVDGLLGLFSLFGGPSGLYSRYGRLAAFCDQHDPFLKRYHGQRRQCGVPVMPVVKVQGRIGRTCGDISPWNEPRDTKAQVSPTVRLRFGRRSTVDVPAGVRFSGRLRSARSGAALRLGSGLHGPWMDGEGTCFRRACLTAHQSLTSVLGFRGSSGPRSGWLIQATC